jgi:hypothetical protein
MGLNELVDEPRKKAKVERREDERNIKKSERKRGE